MNNRQTTQWWRDSAAAEGLSIMDRHVSDSDDWRSAERTGTADFAQAVKATELPVGLNLKILEIGCGAGRMTATLARRFGSVVAVDVAPKFIDMARIHSRANNVDFRVLDGESLEPVANGKYDVVFAYEVFHYLEPQVLRRYIADAHKLLKPGGTLAVQFNTQAVSLRTHASRLVRRTLHHLGVRHWRGWPTAPQFCHRTYQPDWIFNTMMEAGFDSAKSTQPGGRCSWFVAAKAGRPDVQHAEPSSWHRSGVDPSATRTRALAR